MSQNLSIYIHYPFCKSKCPYCDFNSHVKKEVGDDDFALAYESELDYFAAQVKNRKIKSIFFGGGTPSLMPTNLVERILKKISDLWIMDENTEITLEANPTSFESGKFKDFKKAGINRLSMGIQALNDVDLKFLGREHSASEAIKAIKNASDIFDNYSFDLIYARPKQNLKDWETELKRAIELSPNHLSLYQLTIEKGTQFYSSFKKGEFEMPDENLSADFYDLTNEITSKAGLELYEISNYATKGSECEHNLVYWKSEDYLGIGAGAHGRFFQDGSKNKMKTMNFYDPLKWQNKVLENGNAIQEIAQIDKDELLEEIIMMGLRLKEGIHNEVFERHFGKKYQDLFDLKKLEILAHSGLLLCCGDKMVITPKGRILTNAIITQILT
jgi:putative oxygen-independent coproporphyrinogen III oxidase